MTRMFLRGFFLAEFREADMDQREPEGYHARFGDKTHFFRLCQYTDDPKEVLLSLLPEPCREFVTWE